MDGRDNPGCISGITCAVDTCKYHGQSNSCTAAHIDVKNENATRMDDTFCGTFKPMDTWNCV